MLLAVLLTGLTLSTLISRTGGQIGWPEYVLAVLGVAPVALRQRAPMATTLVIAGALATHNVMGYGPFPSNGVGMLIGVFTVATLRPRRYIAVACVAAVAVMLTNPRPLHWSEIGAMLLQVAIAWVLGESNRRWAQRAERLAEEAAQAVARERVRIARELHDVVAHHMSVISLQAGLAEYVLDTDLSTARGALATVSGTSREALAEMRRLLAVLRVDQNESCLQPQPGLADLDELVERTRATGLPVELVVTGRARALAPGPDLCAYRVAQESLTNVLKHAGPARARVELDYGELTLTLAVTDDGHPAAAEPAGSHGIRGMRERAELYGGQLAAGPTGCGFAVRLLLPIGAGR